MVNSLTACSGTYNIQKGADSKSWNAGYRSLQYLDEWEEQGNLPNESGIAAKIMQQANSIGFNADLFLKENKSDKEQYINDMYWTLFSIAGFEQGQYYTGAVFKISDDGQFGADKDYDNYYEAKKSLVDLLEIEYIENYKLLNKRKN